MTDFSYLKYEPVVYGTVLPMTYVSTVEYSPIRRAYIDSVINSLIALNSEPEIVVYINRLKECRDRDWDAETMQVVNEAMRAYHNRYIYINGGGIRDIVKSGVSKLLGTAKEGASAAFGKQQPGTSLSPGANIFRQSFKGVANILNLRDKGSKQPLNVGSMVNRRIQQIIQPQQGGAIELEDALYQEQMRLKEEADRFKSEY